MREFRGWVKISLFLSAYIPFFLIMAVQNLSPIYEVRGVPIPWIAAFFIILSVFSAAVLRKAIKLRKSREPKPKNVSTYRKRNDLLAGYLIAYVFPFVDLNYANWESWAALLIFFSVLAAIQLRSDQLHINPVLAAIGYDIYEVEDTDRGTTDLVLAHKSENVRAGEHLDAVKIGSNIYITP